MVLAEVVGCKCKGWEIQLMLFLLALSFYCPPVV